MNTTLWKPLAFLIIFGTWIIAVIGCIQSPAGSSVTYSVVFKTSDGSSTAQEKWQRTEPDTVTMYSDTDPIGNITKNKVGVFYIETIATAIGGNYSFEFPKSPKEMAVDEKIEGTLQVTLPFPNSNLPTTYSGQTATLTKKRRGIDGRTVLIFASAREGQVVNYAAVELYREEDGDAFPDQVMQQILVDGRTQMINAVRQGSKALPILPPGQQQML